MTAEKLPTITLLSTQLLFATTSGLSGEVAASVGGRTPRSERSSMHQTTLRLS